MVSPIGDKHSVSKKEYTSIFRGSFASRFADLAIMVSKETFTL